MPPPWLLRRMERKTYMFLLSPNPRKRNLFSKEELVSSDPEETAGNGSLPKGKKSFPKEEPVSDPERKETGVFPRKRTSSPRRSWSTVDLKKLLASKAAVPRKSSKKSKPGRLEYGVFSIRTHLLYSNKNKFLRKKQCYFLQGAMCESSLLSELPQVLPAQLTFFPLQLISHTFLCLYYIYLNPRFNSPVFNS